MTEKEFEAIAPKTVIYKVWSEINGVKGKLTKATVAVYVVDGKIETTNPRDIIHFSTWFKRKRGYLFTNYFHAYAYSLKCKERTRDPVDSA